MSSVKNFAAHAAKFALRKPGEIIAAEQIKTMIDPTGFYVERVYFQIDAIKPILEKMNSQLPEIQSGPIQSLSTDYNKISSLSGTLTSAMNEIDKDLPAELIGSEFLIEAFNHLGQFYQYIPHLVSPTAPSMASYVPALQQSLSLVVETLDKICAILPKVSDHLKPQFDKITILNIEYTHWCVALLKCIENVIIDLNFILAYDAVQASNLLQQSISTWIQIITQFSSNVIEQALAEPRNLDEAMQSIALQSPSLFSILESVQELVKDGDFLTSVTEHIVLFMSFVLEKTSETIYNNIVESMKQIISLSTNVSNASEHGELVSRTKSNLELFTSFANTDFVSNSKDAQAAIKSIKAVLRTCEPGTPELCFAAVSTLRCLAAIAPNTIYAHKSTDAISAGIIEILNNIQALIINDTNVIMNFITLKLESFNETLLGHLNYHLSALSEVDKFNPESKDCFSQIARVFASLNCFPKAAEILTEHIEEDVRKAFNDMTAPISIHGSSFSRWFMELSAGNAALAEILSSAEVAAISFTAGESSVPPRLLKEKPLYLAADPSRAADFFDAREALLKTEIPEGAVCGSLARGVLNKASEISSPLFDGTPGLFAASDGEKAVAALTGLISMLSPSLENAKAQLNDTFAFRFAPSLSGSMSLCAIISRAGDFASKLAGFPSSLQSSIDIIWPITSESDSNALPGAQGYINQLGQLFSEFEYTLSTFDQPYKEVDIPEEIRRLRRLESTVPSLNTSSLRSCASILLDFLKGVKSPEALNLLEQYFKFVQNGSVNYSEEAAQLRRAIQENNQSEILKRLASLAAAMSLAMDDMDEKEREYFERRFNELISLIADYLKTRDPSTLRRIDAIANQLINYGQFSNLPEEKKKDTLAMCIADALVGLDEARRGGDTTKAIHALLNLESYLFFNDEELNAKLSPMITDAISRLFKNEHDGYDDLIGELAALLYGLCPDEYERIRSLTNPSDICDAAYDRTEIFRELTNSILLAAKTHSMSRAQIDHTLARLVSIVYESAQLALVSLRQNGLDKTDVIRKFAISTGQMFVALNKFAALSRTIPDLEEGQDISMELRRLVRLMAKDLDNYITTIETPPMVLPLSGFDLIRAEFFTALADNTVQCGHISSRVGECVVEELFSKERNSLHQLGSSTHSDLKAAAEKLANASVGSTVKPFNDAFKEMSSKVDEMLAAIMTPEYNNAVKSSSEACGLTPIVIERALALVDEIVKIPDPKTADKLPDDFVVPPFPTDAPSQEAAFKFLKEAGETLLKETTAFPSAIEGVDNATVLQKTLDLRGLADTFATAAAAMAAATPDPRIQVELQTALHGFASSFSTLQAGVRAKLMVQPDAEKQILDGQQATIEAIKQLLDLGEKAASIVIEDDDESDEVTAELKATAAAIDEMAAKLAQFGAQYGQTGDFNESDLQADDGTFPAFVIAEARKILTAASQIMQRAIQITSGLAKQGIEYPNKKLLINAAQELTEAGGLIMTAAELLIKGEDDMAEWKVIASARIVKGVVAQLVAQVLVQGGDPEGIMNDHAKTVRMCSDRIISKGEAIVSERSIAEDAKNPVKAPNSRVLKLNMQNRVNDYRKNLEEDEKALYQFRKKKQ